MAGGGDDVTVLVLSHEDASRPVTIPPGLQIQRATRRAHRLRIVLPTALLQLTALAHTSDVVVAGTEVGFGLLLASASTRLARRPMAVTVQSRVDVAVTECVNPSLQAATRAALARADLAVCVSRGLVSIMVELGLAADRAILVGNGVDRAAIRAAAAQEPSIALGDGPPVVVAGGRLVHQKGFDLLLGAHARALGRGAPPHRLVILGGGDERESLALSSIELGIEDSVVLAGFVDNPHAVVARAALFVLPSRWEGFSLVLAEALACGIPCVAFDCVAGPSEVLADGAYGRLVPAGDIDDLAEAMRAHLSAPAALTEKARRASEIDAAIFDPQRTAQAHRAALAAVRRRGGRPTLDARASARRPHGASGAGFARRA